MINVKRWFDVKTQPSLIVLSKKWSVRQRQFTKIPATIGSRKLAGFLFLAFFRLRAWLRHFFKIRTKSS